MSKNRNDHPKKIARYLHNKAVIAFVFVFATITAAIGLSQIFAAQSQVYFSLSPVSQSANTNDNRAVDLVLYTYGQPVDNGRVTFIYDSNALSLVSYSGQPGYLRTSVAANTAGSYTFNFQADSSAPSTFSLGTLTFKAKSISATQGARVSYDATTVATYGGSAYPSSYGQGAIVVYAAAAPSPPPPSPTPTPTPAPAPTPSQSSFPTKQTPTAQTPANNTPTAPSAVSPTPSETPTAANNSQSVPPDVSISFPTTRTFIPKKKSNSLVYIIPAIILIIGGAAIAYAKYWEGKPIKFQALYRKKKTNKAVESTLTEENIVIGPALSSIVERALGAAKKIEPALAPLHPLHPLRHPEPQPVTRKLPEPARHTPVEVPKVEEKPKKVQTELDDFPVTVTSQKPDEVEVHVGHQKAPQAQSPVPSALKPSVQPAESPQTPSPQQKAATPAKHEDMTKTSDKPASRGGERVIEPLNLPPLPPLLPIPDPAPSKAQPPSASPPILPSTPAWQAQLQGTKAPDTDEPPDMFELAKQHPESFGSEQLFEAENQEKKQHETDTK